MGKALMMHLELDRSQMQGKVEVLHDNSVSVIVYLRTKPLQNVQRLRKQLLRNYDLEEHIANEFKNSEMKDLLMGKFEIDSPNVSYMPVAEKSWESAETASQDDAELDFDITHLDRKSLNKSFCDEIVK